MAPWLGLGTFAAGAWVVSLVTRFKKKKSHCYITASKLPASDQVPNQFIYGHMLPEKGHV